MKRTVVIIVAIILLSFATKAQNATHIDQYMLPSSFSNCIDINDFRADANISIPLKCGVDAIAIAQPYKLNTTLSVIGISAFVVCTQNKNETNNDSCFFQIRDANANNVLASVRYDTLTPIPSTKTLDSPSGLYEFMFDSALTISSNFTVVATSNYSSYIYILGTGYSPKFTSCNSGTSPKVQYPDGSWKTFSEIKDYYRINGGFLDVFLFPIISNTSGINDNVQVNKYSSLFPNPTRDEINIASSFKINNVVIYNTLGQKIIEETINGNTTKLDVSKFAKGNYIAKIYTDNGVATKKFIVE